MKHYRRLKYFLAGDDGWLEFAGTTVFVIWFIAYTLTGRPLPWL